MIQGQSRYMRGGGHVGPITMVAPLVPGFGCGCYLVLPRGVSDCRTPFWVAAAGGRLYMPGIVTNGRLQRYTKSNRL